MSSEWVEVEIRSSLDAGELLGFLDDPAVPGAWEDGRAIHLYWPSRQWTSDHLTQLRQALRRLTKDGLVEADIVVHSLPDQDWNRQWAESVKPLRVGNRIVIRPSWESVEKRPGQIEIVLDPKQAFGTGHHATTSLLLEWLEEEIRGGESILDVGTGSGLLAMVALRLGAAQATGLDNDPDAIACARGYAVANDFGPELSLQCGTLAAGRTYDVVLANLDRRTLLDLAEPLSACTGTMLLVSGLLVDQRDEIVDAFSRVGLYSSGGRSREDWLALEFRKPESCDGA
jgi:ribosomal protein L11 methyltransferase